MQYLITAYDGTDDDALNRRLSVREAHLALGDKMRDAGTMLYGVALLNDAEQMIGSVIVCEFNTAQELDDYLAVEPYVTGNVWQNITITPCRVGPTFVSQIPSQ